MENNGYLLRKWWFSFFFLEFSSMRLGGLQVKNMFSFEAPFNIFHLGDSKSLWNDSQSVNKPSQSSRLDFTEASFGSPNFAAPKFWKLKPLVSGPFLLNVIEIWSPFSVEKIDLWIWRVRQLGIFLPQGSHRLVHVPHVQLVAQQIVSSSSFLSDLGLGDSPKGRFLQRIYLQTQPSEEWLLISNSFFFWRCFQKRNVYSSGSSTTGSIRLGGRWAGELCRRGRWRLCFLGFFMYVS